MKPYQNLLKKSIVIKCNYKCSKESDFNKHINQYKNIIQLTTYIYTQMPKNKIYDM